MKSIVGARGSRARYYDEVVSAYVPDPARFRRGMLNEDVGDGFDNLVAGAVSINVVKGLEVVQIKITDTEGDFFADQFVNLVIDGNAARQ